MLALAACASCATPRTHRTGPPIVLSNDPPRSPCEERQWVQLAPTHVGAEATETVTATTTWVMYSQHDESADGVAAYQNNLQLRLPVERVAKLIDTSRLRPDVDAEARAIRSKRSTANGFIVASLLATGIGGAVALSTPDDPTAGLVIMGVGAAAAVVSLLVRPHNADVAWAQVRDRIFVNEETDMNALYNGIDTLNGRTRATCAQ